MFHFNRNNDINVSTVQNRQWTECKFHMEPQLSGIGNNILVTITIGKVSMPYRVARKVAACFCWVVHLTQGGTCKGFNYTRQMLQVCNWDIVGWSFVSVWTVVSLLWHLFFNIFRKYCAKQSQRFDSLLDRLKHVGKGRRRIWDFIPDLYLVDYIEWLEISMFEPSTENTQVRIPLTSSYVFGVKWKM